MCKNSSSTTTSTPNPTATSAYNSLISAAQQQASQPLQLYQGSLVAPLNSTQTGAINSISNAQGIAQPYINEAAQYAQQGATPVSLTPFSNSAVQQYESPYTSDVVNATEQQLQLQDQQQQQSLTGSTAAAGALGGDRQAVLQSQLAGQQDTANNATIAGLENQGYTQALGQFNTQNQESMAQQEANNQFAQNTAFSLGSLGSEAENTALAGANAQLNAGTLEQQVAQENLNVPYEQYLQEQAYPYQNLNFESGIVSGLGSLLGGTSTTTSQQPFTLFRRGGHVRRHLDTGGTSSIPGIAPSYLEMMEAQQERAPDGGGSLASLPAVPNESTSFIPQSSLTSGRSTMPTSGGSTGQGSNNILQGAAGDVGAFNTLSNAFSGGPAAASGAGLSAGAADASGGGGLGAGAADASGGAGFFSDIGDALAAIFKRGGRVRHLADGGDTDDSDEDQVAAADALLDKLYPNGGGSAPSASLANPSGAQQPGTGASLARPDQVPSSWSQQATHTAAPVVTPPDDADTPRWSDNGAPVGTSDSLANPKIIQSPYTPHTSPWASIGVGLLSALASRNLSRGLLAGVQNYEQQSDKDKHPQIDNSGATQMLRYNDGTIVDLGIPTEAALNAKSTADYRNADIQMRQQENQASLAQRTDQANQADQERKAQIDVARINAGLPPLYTPTTGPESQPNGSAAGGDIYSQFVSKMLPLENASGNSGAQNPRSSATGNGQFIDSTWLKTTRAAHPEWAGIPDAQLLQLRTDPGLSREMAETYSRQNGAQLAAAGMPVNMTSLGLAYRFGADGAHAVMAAPADTPLPKILPPKVIAANPSLINQTAGQYIQDLSSQLGSSSAPPTSPVYGKFRPPQTISVSDGAGRTKQVLAQQNEATGQWVTADQTRAPINGQNISIVPQAEIGMSDVPVPGDTSLHGDAYLKTLPAGQQSIVKAMVDGRQAPPTSFALRTPYWQQMLGAANQYDPSFDQTTWGGRVKTRTSFTAGQDANNVTAINTALQHAGVVQQALGKLDNTGIPLANTIKNWWGEQTGNPAPTNAREAVDALASEGRKVFAGTGGGNLTELENWQKNFPINGSQQQQSGALKEFVSLLDSRLDALTDKYNRGMGRSEDRLTLLSPHARAVYQNLTGNQQQTSASIPPAAASFLKQNPALRSQFDAKYGSGASAQVLGQ